MKILRGGSKRNLIFFFILFFTGTAKSETYYTLWEYIVLTQDINISAHRLCQDGLYIYFIDRYHCENSKGQFKCDGDLKIAPLRSVEKIILPSGESLTRFYEIKTTFRYEEYVKTSLGTKLVDYDYDRLPFCTDRARHEPQNIETSRMVIGVEERDLFASLIQSQITLLNTPYGNLRTIKNLAKDESKSPDITKVSARVQTPFCNNQISNEQIWQMSGEYSGNGIFQVNSLQTVSRDMFIEKIRYQKDSATGELKKIYDFTCTPTWEL